MVSGDDCKDIDHLFFIALSFVASGMIFVPYASSYLGVNHGTTSHHGSLIWIVVHSLTCVTIRLILATMV